MGDSLLIEINSMLCFLVLLPDIVKLHFKLIFEAFKEACAWLFLNEHRDRIPDAVGSGKEVIQCVKWLLYKGDYSWQFPK